MTTPPEPQGGEALKPCPFCQAALVVHYGELTFWKHKPGGCVLDHLEIFGPNGTAVWNRRAPEKVGMREALAIELRRARGMLPKAWKDTTEEAREMWRGFADDFLAEPKTKALLAAIGLPPPVVEKIEDLGLVASKPMLPGRIEPDREPAGGAE